MRDIGVMAASISQDRADVKFAGRTGLARSRRRR
jgi:hypothetical protein